MLTRRELLATGHGANHAFHADYRPSDNRADAEDGWKRCTGWFEKYLNG